MKVYDSFTFNDELDLLECRLTELDGIADRFILVEATTVQGDGRPKPLHYAENAERFAPWKDRIIHVIADDLPPGADPWIREKRQRDWIARGLVDAEADDLLIFSDVDEIPAVPAVRQAIARGGGHLYNQRCLIFAVDWELPYMWQGTASLPVGSVRGSVASVRNFKSSFPLLQDGGWHMTWLGGTDGIRRKLDAHCHTEANEMIRRRLDAGTLYEKGIFWGGNGPEEDTQMAARDVDETWPRWIYERRCPETWFRPR